MGVRLEDVSAVIVTRGDVDLQPVLDSLPFTEIVIWDNSRRDDLKVYGRYAAIDETTRPYIYTQDDDAIVPAEQLLERYQGGLLVNVPPLEKPWLAWGAIFEVGQPELAFATYLNTHQADDEFLRWADVVFATLTPWDSVDLGHTDLLWATAPNRMMHQEDHYTSQERMEQLCVQLDGRAVRA